MKKVGTFIAELGPALGQAAVEQAMNVVNLHGAESNRKFFCAPNRASMLHGAYHLDSYQVGGAQKRVTPRLYHSHLTRCPIPT